MLYGVEGLQSHPPKAHLKLHQLSNFVLRSISKEEGEYLPSRGIFGSGDYKRCMPFLKNNIQDSMRSERCLEMNIATHPCYFVEALRD